LQNNWSFSGAAFRRFLNWIDEGADSGGEKYLEIRHRLVLYFARKNCTHPNDLADETLTRVARRLEEEGGITDPPPPVFATSSLGSFFSSTTEVRNYTKLASRRLWFPDRPSPT
jgi:hypothetical protein